ncbi:hypothetical protein LTV02_12340 [Nocardia yamanashiensis]|uniref:hypothetical protein n=1 Tax=Nocardia yamanashiensis TaxID=209247 RepID=UPI001E440534|nr:hypothetical protein [Nocardia yamanashiensis]UGT44121.1 hypothetical protein LTV02_12340 [Nocardia yamanashiensis]
MEREVFAARLAAASAAAVRCARTQLIEDLPAPLAFRVRLNQSYDGIPAQPGEIRFAEDDSRSRAIALHRCDFETVVDTLWRRGHVPQWVNLAVVGISYTATIIEVICCGRYSADEDELYQMPGGTTPFHAVGPVLPPAHDGNRFSIHTRSECWGHEDLETLRSSPDQVWSLKIETSDFDHRMLAAVPDLPNVEIIEHTACTLTTEVSAAFTRFPKLRILRLDLEANHFHLGASPLPALTSLELHGRDTIRLDLSFPKSLSRLRLTASGVTPTARSPLRVTDLDLHLPHSSDGAITDLLNAISPHRNPEPARHPRHRFDPASPRVLPPHPHRSDRHPGNYRSTERLSDPAPRLHPVPPTTGIEIDSDR